MRIHLDVNEIGEAKLIECKAELELAKILLKSGLLRGAAVKVIQAWRAYLSYIASLNAT
jgi:Archaeal PaREP1/PaREP8 family.